MAATGLDLMGTFVNNFNIDDIYEAGWFAAQQWVGFVSGTLVALAVGIRSFEEKINMISTGRSNYLGMFTNVILVAIAIGAYFTLAWLVIQLMNAVYGSLNHTDSVRAMTTQLDQIRTGILDKEYEFTWSDIAESLYTVFGAFAYAITFCMLILLMLLSRIAHAILVSFCLFWGAVALPMSITTGLKQLRGWKTMCLTALFWPIVESFFLYLITTALHNMLVNGQLGVEDMETWNMGTMLFYFAVFSIINLLLASFILSAPLIASSLASGTGGITGVVGSFGAAAIGAGAIAGRSLVDKFNSGGRSTFQAAQRKMGFGNEKTPPSRGGGGGGPTGGVAQQSNGWGVGYNNANLSFGQGFAPEGANPSVPKGSIGSGAQQPVGNTTGGQAKTPPKTSAGGGSTTPLQSVPSQPTGGIGQVANADGQPDGADSAEQQSPADEAKKRQTNQARRGAIINQQKSKSSPK
jgi:hypothetical protein